MRFRLRSASQSNGMVHRVHGRPLAPPWPDGHRVVHFGMGCFWSAERRFWDLDGVWTTAVGFTPDHTEVVRVVFDPVAVALEDLLAVFWEGHDPTLDQGRLYRSVIGTDDPDLRARAERGLTAERGRRGSRVRTVIGDGGFMYAGADQQQYFG